MYQSLSSENERLPNMGKNYNTEEEQCQPSYENNMDFWIAKNTQSSDDYEFSNFEKQILEMNSKRKPSHLEVTDSEILKAVESENSD